MSDNVPDFSKDGYKPLFLQWLKEWKDDAVKNQNNLQYSFANALRSLKSYPLPVYGGYGCSHLQFFGDFTCKKLEKKLVAYLKENKLQRITAPDPFLVATSGELAALGTNVLKKKPRSPQRISKNSVDVDDNTQPTKPRRAPKKPAVPKRKSTELSQSFSEEAADSVGDLPSKVISRPKKKLLPKSKSANNVVEASSSSTSGFVVGSSSTSSLRTISSTSVGLPIAKSSSQNLLSRPVLTIGGGGGFTTKTFSSSSVDSNKPSTSGTQQGSNRFSSVNTDEFILYPGSFDVVLCVDNQEIHGKGNVRSKMDVIVELEKQNALFEVRNLKVGDFLWIAKEKSGPISGKKTRELVLDFIAERKRGDDLATSIKDGRYTCQKHRMKTSGLKRIIYIVEESHRFMHKGLADQALHQALANIEVHDRFSVKQTANLRGTVDFLLMMTDFLKKIYLTKTLQSCSYQDRLENSEDLNFNRPIHKLLSFPVFSAVAKTNQSKNVSQAFLLQLLALDGVSPAKAAAIVEKFPTLRHLLAAYDECATDAQKITLLRDIKFGVGLSSIGPTISKKLFQLYCTEGPFAI